VKGTYTLVSEGVDIMYIEVSGSGSTAAATTATTAPVTTTTTLAATPTPTATTATTTTTTIVTKKSPVTSAELSEIIRPYYLQDLTGDIDIDSYYSIHIWRKHFDPSICGAWLGVGSDCSGLQPMGSNSPHPSSTVCPFSQFTGARGTDPKSYTDAYKLVTPLNAVNEWTIFGMVIDVYIL
jgi:hypothetical protein